MCDEFRRNYTTVSDGWQSGRPWRHLLLQHGLHGQPPATRTAGSSSSATAASSVSTDLWTHVSDDDCAVGYADDADDDDGMIADAGHAVVGNEPDGD